MARIVKTADLSDEQKNNLLSQLGVVSSDPGPGLAIDDTTKQLSVAYDGTTIYYDEENKQLKAVGIPETEYEFGDGISNTDARLSVRVDNKSIAFDSNAALALNGLPKVEGYYAMHVKSDGTIEWVEIQITDNTFSIG